MRWRLRVIIEEQWLTYKSRIAIATTTMPNLLKCKAISALSSSTYFIED